MFSSVTRNSLIGSSWKNTQPLQISSLSMAFFSMHGVGKSQLVLPYLNCSSPPSIVVFTFLRMDLNLLMINSCCLIHFYRCLTAQFLNDYQLPNLSLIRLLHPP